MGINAAIQMEIPESIPFFGIPTMVDEDAFQDEMFLEDLETYSA